MGGLDWGRERAAIWRARRGELRPVGALDPVGLSDLVGIDQQKARLLENTRRFLAGLPANNALLWGSRGSGKSSLVKEGLNACAPEGLRLVEIYWHDLRDLPDVLDALRGQTQRFIIYCDDFSFTVNDDTYIGLKNLLEGSIEVPPQNVLFYATSNRRHLLPEFMQDNQSARSVDGQIHYTDAVEEQISLSDRFGLWLSFYSVDMEGYLAIVDHLFRDFGGDREPLHRAAKLFAITRGSHTGRTAKQFYNAFVDREEES